MKVADKVIKYIKADNENAYGLEEEVSAVLTGDDVCFVGGKMIAEAYTTEDASLTIYPCEKDLVCAVKLLARPFPAESRLWNGPDVIADNQYRSMLASLFHDLIWGHAGELARAWGVTKRDVMTWGDGVLYALWLFASSDSLVGRVEARLAWQVCEYSRGWYHGLKKLLGLHSILFALLLAAGCGTPPDWHVAEISGTNAVLRAMGAQAAKSPNNVQAEDGKTAEVIADEKSKIVQDNGADAVDYSALDWCWGGFGGKNAKPVDGAEIGSLKVSSSGLSYKWVNGGCEKLGATSREDYDHTLACLFCRIDGEWRGGKIDWISTSRTSRSFENISGGYGGWDRQAVGKADMYAFVIVSADGGKRTNVITARK